MSSIVQQESSLLLVDTPENYLTFYTESVTNWAVSSRLHELICCNNALCLLSNNSLHLLPDFVTMISLVSWKAYNDFFNLYCACILCDGSTQNAQYPILVFSMPCSRILSVIHGESQDRISFGKAHTVHNWDLWQQANSWSPGHNHSEKKNTYQKGTIMYRTNQQVSGSYSCPYQDQKMPRFVQVVPIRKPNFPPVQVTGLEHTLVQARYPLVYVKYWERIWSIEGRGRRKPLRLFASVSQISQANSAVRHT